MGVCPRGIPRARIAKCMVTRIVIATFPCESMGTLYGQVTPIRQATLLRAQAGILGTGHRRVHDRSEMFEHVQQVRQIIYQDDIVIAG